MRMPLIFLFVSFIYISILVLCQISLTKKIYLVNKKRAEKARYVTLVISQSKIKCIVLSVIA